MAIMAEQWSTTWGSVELCGAVGHTVLQYGTVWDSVEQCEEVWGCVEKNRAA